MCRSSLSRFTRWRHRQGRGKQPASQTLWLLSEKQRKKHVYILFWLTKKFHCTLLSIVNSSQKNCFLSALLFKQISFRIKTRKWNPHYGQEMTDEFLLLIFFFLAFFFFFTFSLNCLVFLLTFHSLTVVEMRCSVWATFSRPAWTLCARAAFSALIFLSSRLM